MNSPNATTFFWGKCYNYPKGWRLSWGLVATSMNVLLLAAAAALAVVFLIFILKNRKHLHHPTIPYFGIMAAFDLACVPLLFTSFANFKNYTNYFQPIEALLLHGYKVARQFAVFWKYGIPMLLFWACLEQALSVNGQRMSQRGRVGSSVCLTVLMVAVFFLHMPVVMDIDVQYWLCEDNQLRPFLVKECTSIYKCYGPFAFRVLEILLWGLLLAILLAHFVLTVLSRLRCTAATKCLVLVTLTNFLFKAPAILLNVVNMIDYKIRYLSEHAYYIIFDLINILYCFDPIMRLLVVLHHRHRFSDSPLALLQSPPAYVSLENKP